MTSCNIWQESCLPKFLEAFWQSPNPFNLRWFVKSETVLVQSIKLTFNNTQQSSESRKLQFYCMLYLLQESTGSLQFYYVFTYHLLKMFMFSYMPLYHTLFNVYGHICITKVFGKWLLVGWSYTKDSPVLKGILN